jgi:hypothetical protein
MTARLDAKERILGTFVLAVLTIACVGWWIGVPLATLYALGEATDDGPTHFVGGLLGVPLMMFATAPILIWLNGLYLRVTGILSRAEADEEESGWRRRVRGPLEPMLAISFVVAIVALSIWFFFIADTAPTSLM